MADPSDSTAKRSDRATLPPAPTAEVADLEHQARYRRDRLALYRARMQGPNFTSTERLRELEREAEAADERLRTARRLGKT